MFFIKIDIYLKMKMNYICILYLFVIYDFKCIIFYLITKHLYI